MIELPEERRPPITPQLAVRVAVLGVVALALFAVVFFRLWFLQVLSGDQYLAQANNNRIRDVTVQAPRGDIVDRNGQTLVDNRLSTAVTIESPRLPPEGARRDAVLRNLSRVIGMDTRPRGCKLGKQVIPLMPAACKVKQEEVVLPYANVTLKPDASRPEVNYIYEHQEQFPGVTVEPLFLRAYPHNALAAQLFGTIGEISPKELKWAKFRGVKQGTLVGQGGIEATYDRYLRGVPGATRVQVNSLGQPKAYLRRRPFVQGKTLRLSLDLNLQREGQQALAQGIGLANGNGNPAQAAAFVAMDPRNGAVLGMGSVPSFNPNEFAKPIPKKKYEQDFGPSANFPLLNRAVQSAYPTGSTFKMITATAALQSGLITPDNVIDDPGQLTVGAQVFKDAGGAGAGAVSLRQAIQVSSDVFFYTLGRDMNDPRPRGGALQDWAHRFGIGRKTGIDLPGEVSGLLASPAERVHRNVLEAKCRKGKRQRGRPCGIGTLEPWTIGQNVQLATGQGDLLATPLQMATAYASLANGGRVVKPHVGLQVEDAAGKVLQRIDPGPSRRIAIAAQNRQAIMDGLRGAAGSPGGTSYDVFKGFPRVVYGKTGTAQRPPHADQSWYVCFVQDAQRPIVVAVTVEQGGFGAQAAAPAARLILSQWFGAKKKVVAGSSHTL